MKKKFKFPLDSVVNGDCLAVMADIADNSVDMCFADPPFNLSKNYSSYRDKRGEGDYIGWCREWLGEMVRITKPTGAVFVHNIPKWLTHYADALNHIARFRHWIAWHATGRPLGKTLLPSHYGILFYVKDDKRFKFYDLRAPHVTCRQCGEYLKDYGGKSDQRHPFGALVGDVWTDIHRIRHNRRRDAHPCQLPPHLLERLILMCTDAGDVVFDPFMGTGTTAVAAKALGRRYLGADIDAQYAAIAKSKADDISPSKHRGVYVSQYLGKIITIRDADANKLFGRQLTAPQKRKRAVLSPPVARRLVKAAR